MSEVQTQAVNQKAKAEKMPKALTMSVFVLSIISLSWFFAGWRQVHETNNFGDWALLISGTLLTCLFVFLQAYWIYCEEKSKGTLRKQIVFFEKINQRVNVYRQAKSLSKQINEKRG